MKRGPSASSLYPRLIYILGKFVFYGAMYITSVQCQLSPPLFLTQPIELNYRSDKKIVPEQFNTRNYPHPNTIKQLFEKFKRTGGVTGDFVDNVGRPQSATIVANVHAVKNISTACPNSSVRKTAAACSLSKASTYNIVRKCLIMFLQKLQAQKNF